MSDLMCAATIEEQTGWHRPYPESICQDIAYLEKVYEHDFDLNNADFRKYLQDRGVCSFKSLEGDPLAKMINFLMNWDEKRIFDDPWLAYSETGLKFDDAHKKTSIRIWKITKGRIQDAWEIWKENETF
jgi:hypothetical protein